MEEITEHKKMLIDFLYTQMPDKKELMKKFGMDEKKLEEFTKEILNNLFVSPDIIIFLCESLELYPTSTKKDKNKPRYIG